MKTLLKITPVLLLFIGLYPCAAQECEPYYIANEGSVREMTSYDKKDKLTGSTVQTVKEIRTIGNRIEYIIGTISRDEKGKEYSSGDLRMSCEDGIFRMDMKNFLNEETMSGFEEMQVTMDATDLEYPASMSAGQTLGDGIISVRVSNQGMTMMTMVVRIYDRKVEAEEDMTTPAGTFSCYRMSYTIETKAMFTLVARCTDWVARDVGSVRSETFDKNGKLVSYTVLTSLK